MNVSEFGESGLISRISEIVNRRRNETAPAWDNLILGIGDDAAAWYGDSSIQLATVDALRQGVHFSFETTGWRDLGWKALAVNLSDIAAMGGLPRYALVALALPGDTDAESVFALYEGMTELARKFDVVVAGGDIDRSPLVEVSITVFGSTRTREQPLLTRAGAKAGEKIAVSGYLGAAAGGLKMLSRHLTLDKKTADSLRTAFLCPFPRVTEGQILIDSGVRAAIDISDGLVADLNHICKASHVSARIEAERVPVSPDIKTSFGGEALELALSGGEDYELLFTASPAIIERVKASVSCPVSIIGDVIAGGNNEVSVIGADGRPVRTARTGWEHFTSH
ncbi:MAG: thiamine-phosphate kinase [Dehalococcoidales bacterium]|nr:thiamine-phosphate kinase [Dehalococcoidales bacterium]